MSGLLNEPRPQAERDLEALTNGLHDLERRKILTEDAAARDGLDERIALYRRAVENARAIAFPPEREKVGTGESFVRGAVPGGAATIGAAKYANEALASGPSMVPSRSSPWGEPAGFSVRGVTPLGQRVDDERVMQARAAEDHPIAYGAGDVSGRVGMSLLGLPLPLVTGGKTAADVLGAGGSLPEAAGHGLIDLAFGKAAVAMLPKAGLSGSSGKQIAGAVAGEAALGGGASAAHQGLDIAAGQRESVDPTDVAVSSALSAVGALVPHAARTAQRAIRDQSNVEAGRPARTAIGRAIRTRETEPPVPPALRGGDAYHGEQMALDAGSAALRDIQKVGDVTRAHMDAAERRILSDPKNTLATINRSTPIVDLLDQMSSGQRMDDGTPRIVNELPGLDSVYRTVANPIQGIPGQGVVWVPKEVSLPDLVKLRRDLDQLGKMGRMEGRSGAEYRQLSGAIQRLIASEAGDPELGALYSKRAEQLSKLEEAHDNLVLVEDRSVDAGRASVEQRAASRIKKVGESPVIDKQMNDAEGSLMSVARDADVPLESPELMSRQRRWQADKDLSIRGVRLVGGAGGVSAYANDASIAGPLLGRAVEPAMSLMSDPDLSMPIMMASQSVARRKAEKKKDEKEKAE